MSRGERGKIRSGPEEPWLSGGYSSRTPSLGRETYRERMYEDSSSLGYRFDFRDYFYGIDCGNLNVGLVRDRFKEMSELAASDWRVQLQTMNLVESVDSAEFVDLAAVPRGKTIWFAKLGVWNVDKMSTLTEEGRHLQATRLLVRASTTIDSAALARMGITGKMAEELLALAANNRREPKPVTFIGLTDYYPSGRYFIGDPRYSRLGYADSSHTSRTTSYDSEFSARELMDSKRTTVDGAMFETVYDEEVPGGKFEMVSESELDLDVHDFGLRVSMATGEHFYKVKKRN